MEFGPEGCLALSGNTWLRYDVAPPVVEPQYPTYKQNLVRRVIVDGARRDRLIWAGDMAIAVPGVVVSTNDLISVMNALNSLLVLQNVTTDQIPYAGIGYFADSYSETYHLYCLIGISNYYLYTGNLGYISTVWTQWKFAMDWSISRIDQTGLMNVTLSADWLCFGMGAHNIEANSILYHALNEGIFLANALNDSTVADQYAIVAARIKLEANARFWNETAGFYNDNETSTLHLQDGNSWAVVANLTDSAEKVSRISTNLQSRWGKYGAPAPEARTAISPFIGDFELQTHFAAHDAIRALELIRLQWGFMISDPRMTNSTFIEGYDASGELHYSPYPNDVRISHAHGWSTGPISTLTFRVAGIQLIGANGSQWRIQPQLGDLKHVHAGFRTGLGLFENKINVKKDGSFAMEFSTPMNSSGAVLFEPPKCSGQLRLHNVDGACADTVVEVFGHSKASIEINGLRGGKWEAQFHCNCNW